MKYKFFQNVDCVEELKKQYKTLAFKYHPDRGGNKEDMQRIKQVYTFCANFLLFGEPSSSSFITVEPCSLRISSRESLCRLLCGSSA